MLAEIIAVGSELLTPFRQDTNSLFATEQFNSLGVTVVFKTIVGDRRPHLAQAVSHALSRADIVCVMGGLGPTEDDITREAVAEALGVRLRRNGDLLAALYKRFAERRASMPGNNSKQADLIDGAEILPNANGTAPGQWLDTVVGEYRKIVILLPGPPMELKAMFTAECLPRLQAALPPRHIARRVLKMAMLPESEVDARLAPIYTRFNDVETTILAHAGEVQLHLQCTKAILEVAQGRVNDLASRVEEEMEDVIFSSNGESLEQIVLYYLEIRGATVAVAESCTGGLLAQRMTSISGSSRSFLGGAVVYTDDLKVQFADVPEDLIEEKGAVSREVAEALAHGIRRRAQSTIGVGITGIAGPTGGSEAKPVGLVYIALDDGKEINVCERKFRGDRERVRWLASQQALDMIRRKFM
ncbi:MAG TPA: competence/damage-inducible protein A [Acidobacteriaceae bacterium]|nr:competence/damage-inducible protein A [Acidobacteriaceae bacterium]